MSQLITTTNQKGASAGHDIVGRDKVTQIFVHGASLTKVEKLLVSLASEKNANQEITTKIEALARFYEHKAIDGINGLVNKLNAGGRSSEIDDALEKKELFVKMLERWSMYASAQQIFSILLAQVEYLYNRVILPQIPQKECHEIDLIVHERIISPIVDECASGLFNIDHAVVCGMIYWLAEQCYIRWH